MERARDVLKKYLPYYMIPSFFIHLDQIPLLPNGKLDRKSLPEPDINSFRTEYEAPANETEKRIVNSFEQVLGIEQVSVNDDFYELGGDSVHSIQAVEFAGASYSVRKLLISGSGRDFLSSFPLGSRGI